MVLLLLFFNILIIAKYVDCLFHILNRFIKLFWIAERECNKDEMKNRAIFIEFNEDDSSLHFNFIRFIKVIFPQPISVPLKFFLFSLFLSPCWLIYLFLSPLFTNWFYFSLSLFFVTNWFSFLYSFCFLKLYSLLKILTLN